MRLLLYITSHRMGGAEWYFIGLAKYLQEQGHHLVVVSKPNALITEHLRNVGIEPRTWPMWGKGDLPTMFRLLKLMEEEKIELVNTHLSTAHWLGGMAARRMRIPVISTVHASNTATTVRKADWIWAVSDGVRKHLMLQAIRDERIRVLYCGVDTSRFNSLPDRNKVREALNLPADAKVILTIANLIDRKGHALLLRAASKIAEKDRAKLHLLFAGDGPERPKLAEMASMLGVENNLSLLGYYTDVPALFAASDMFILPSFKEGLPLAITEAMAAGVPVIATDVGGVAEQVFDRKTGRLLMPGDEKGLQTAIEEWLARPEEARKMAEDASALVHKQFDRQKCLSKVEQFFIQAIDQTRSPGHARF